MNTPLQASRRTYAGLFLITLTTLMYEILLTRIFSVTMWYHLAFMAISVAMFGMTAGAIIVYLLPAYFNDEKSQYRLGLFSLLYGVAIPLCFLAQLAIPFVATRSVGVVSLTYLVTSIPFVFSGICVSVALTRFPRQLSTLYAADLSGAAIGCILLIYLLKVIDGPSAMIALACVACLAAVFFYSPQNRRSCITAVAFTLLFACLTVANAVSISHGYPGLRITWAKGAFESKPAYERWNSFSRIRIATGENSTPFGWGLSTVKKFQITPGNQLQLEIDSAALTVLSRFNGNENELEYLKYDVTNIAHYLKSNARVLVIGVGGGRDILSALAFHQKSVVGVEINGNILNALNRDFGDFTGHLDRNPKITFVNDEGRAYLSRDPGQFDIIQASLIDTWAATSAGAFALSENALYTLEAWELFFKRLSSNGIVTFSRWYTRRGPLEMFRLTALASGALVKSGIKNPRDHIVIVKNVDEGVGTLLMSKAPFSENDLKTLENVTNQLRFEIVLSPKYSQDPVLERVASPDVFEFTDGLAVDISPPTDDRPFFFNTTRIGRAIHGSLPNFQINRVFGDAVLILGYLLLFVVLLTVACILLPLFLTRKKGSLEGAGPLVAFFAAIGFGFMLIEISQMQRLIIFLGHPTYSLSALLFSLLLSSGIGSYWTSGVNAEDMVSLKTRGGRFLIILLGVLVIFGFLAPRIVLAFAESSVSARIFVATVMLFPIGFFMGMAFPLGMKLASIRGSELTPWLWGINGATSVCASVVAVVFAMALGISATFWIGFCCYGAAFLAFSSACKRLPLATATA